MVKVLIGGNVDNNWQLLIDRVNTLQNSSHGPFHVLLLCGTTFVDETEFSKAINSIVFPIPTFGFKQFHLSTSSLPSNFSFFVSPSGNYDLGIMTVLKDLTVGFCNSLSNSVNIDEIQDICNGVGFRGCDLYVSTDWPREMHCFVEELELQTIQNLGVGFGAGSTVVAEISKIMQPRYHFASGQGVFFQRSPYRNEQRQPAPCTRFISLAQVSNSKDKNKKWLHALSLEPTIINMLPSEITETPANVTDCPYVSVTNTKRKQPPPPPGPPPSMSTTSVGKKSKLVDDSTAAAAPAGGAFFFGAQAQSRPGGDQRNNLVAPNDQVCTLFIGSLSRETTELNLIKALPHCLRVKIPSGKFFAFADFDCHQSAKKVLEAAARHGLVMNGRTLTVGWGNLKEGSGSGGKGGDVRKVLVDADSKTLYVGGLPVSTGNDTDAESSCNIASLQDDLHSLFKSAVNVQLMAGKPFAFVEFANYAAANEVLAQYLQDSTSFKWREVALNVGWARGSCAARDVHGGAAAAGGGRVLTTTPPSADSCTLFVGGLPINASELEIQQLFKSTLAIRKPEGKDFAFLEFASHSQAAAYLPQSPDGGADQRPPLVLRGHEVVVGWATGRSADQQSSSASTHAADCWFCLGSASVKVHLVVSVADQAYLALPRGGLSNFHVMVSPIECVPSRVHLSLGAKRDMAKYELAVEEFYKTLGCAMMVYERAIRTKGKDHMQEHIIPLPVTKISDALSKFVKCSETNNLRFHEILDSRDVDEVVVDMAGGPYQEYFYASIPVNSDTRRRFVYVHEGSGNQFPMHFGMQMAAEVLGDPRRGHWKNCVQSEAEEVKIADEFRNLFEKFDFTLV